MKEKHTPKVEVDTKSLDSLKACKTMDELRKAWEALPQEQRIAIGQEELGKLKAALNAPAE